MANRRPGAGYAKAARNTGDNGNLTSRGAGALVLVLLCPPLGLMYMWRNGIFRSRGRMFITGLAALEMVFLISMFLPKPEMTAILPAASVPQRVTYAPQGDVSNALTNLQALLKDDYATPAPTDGLTEEERARQQAQREAEEQAILNTTVYSVYSGARFYHSIQNCGQMNNRVLTVEEALSLKLGACNECNPPHL